MDSSLQHRVQPGDWVVLHSSDGRKVLGNVTHKSTARICKRKRKISSLIGHSWGQNFAILGNDTLKPVPDTLHKNLADESSMACEKNNRFLQDTTANQTLEHETINQLKQSGVQGEKLVQTVAQHSSTFKDKTAFSQDKYLQRKRAKFDLHVRIVRPTTASLCDVYIDKSPDKTLHMRCDSLALLLAHSGVRAGARVLIYENCIGLVTGAVAERLGGSGVAINLFSGSSTPGIELLRMLNLPTDHMRSIVHTPIQLLDNIDTTEAIDCEPIKYMSAHVNDNNTKSKEEQQPEKPSDDDAPAEGYAPNATRAEAIALRPKRGQLKQWLKSGCDCLIVATRYDVVKIFDTIFKYLAPSGCFSAYCMHLQDAADLQYALQLSRMATRVELWESTLVNHQILPGRTHPEMTDRATGGYVVTGIRIETTNDHQ